MQMNRGRSWKRRHAIYATNVGCQSSAYSWPYRFRAAKILPASHPVSYTELLSSAAITPIWQPGIVWKVWYGCAVFRFLLPARHLPTVSLHSFWKHCVNILKVVFRGQVSCCKRAEKAILAFPQEIPDMVPATRRTKGNNGGLWTRHLCLLWLRGCLVPTKENRIQVCKIQILHYSIHIYITLHVDLNIVTWKKLNWISLVVLYSLSPCHS